MFLPTPRASQQTRKGLIMGFYAVLDQVIALLRQRGLVSYRALKRQFDLDDASLDDLKVEIIEVQQCAMDQEGTMLVWTGEVASAVTPKPVQTLAPLSYTPPYLAEKIFTSRSALEGELKLVTVLFADLKGSGEEALRLATLEGRGRALLVVHVCLGSLYLAQGDLEHAIRVLQPGLTFVEYRFTTL